jgi:hypothetical protein
MMSRSILPLVAVLAAGAANAQEMQPSFEDLERRFQSADTDHRASIAEAWGKKREPRAVGLLARALASDAAAQVRTKAAWALGAIAASEATSALARALEADAEGKVRYWAAWALGRLGGTGGTSALERALSDRDASVRAQAATALGAVGDRAATAALGKALRDRVKQVRTAAVLSLQKLGAGDDFIRNNLPPEDRGGDLTAERKSHAAAFGLGLLGAGLVYADKPAAGWSLLGTFVVGVGLMAGSASGAFDTRTICQDGTELLPGRTEPCGFSTQEARSPGKKAAFLAGAILGGSAWLVNLIWSQVAVTRYNQRLDDVRRTSWRVEPFFQLSADARLFGASVRF